MNEQYQKSEILRGQIAHVLDTDIRPGLQAAGGDIEFVEFDRGVVVVRLTGVCGFCSGTALAFIADIERQLKERIPEVDYVELST